MSDPARPPAEPELAVEFGLIHVAERVQWRTALACHLLAQTGVQGWKRDESVEPMANVVALYVGEGVTSPDVIADRILNAATR